VDLRAVNRRVVESFIKSGSFDSLDARRAALFAALDRAMESGQKDQRDREQGQSSLFGGMDGDGDGHAAPAADRIRDVSAWGEGERLAFEKESLGFFITGHPLERSAASWRNGPPPPPADSWRWRTAERSQWAGSSPACVPSRPARATAWPRSCSRTSRAAWRPWSSRRPTRRWGNGSRTTWSCS
jgi:DNA polymerase-3 subunit alpha